MTVEAPQIGAVARGGTRAEAWWAFPAVPLLAAAIGFTWMLHGMLQRAYGMTGEAWDLAYDQQVIWNVSQGHGFYSSFARADFLGRSEEHTSELQSRGHLVCRLLLEKK